MSSTSIVIGIIVVVAALAFFACEALVRKLFAPSRSQSERERLVRGQDGNGVPSDE